MDLVVLEMIGLILDMKIISDKVTMFRFLYGLISGSEGLMPISVLRVDSYSDVN
jgi:hypothetical protein